MTAQKSDFFSIDGVPARLMNCPALPWHHPRLLKLTQEEVRAEEEASIKKTKTINSGPGISRFTPWTFVHSTACWRRYIATWRLEADRLYLDRIVGIYRIEGDEPLFADWVTEVLRVSQGELLQYVHMGFGSIYEKDLFLDVRMGVVVNRRERDNRDKQHDEEKLAEDNYPSHETVTPGWKPGDH